MAPTIVTSVGFTYSKDSNPIDPLNQDKNKKEEEKVDKSPQNLQDLIAAQQKEEENDEE